jgi:hypothetical protein
MPKHVYFELDLPVEELAKKDFCQDRFFCPSCFQRILDPVFLGGHIAEGAITY